MADTSNQPSDKPTFGGIDANLAASLANAATSPTTEKSAAEANKAMRRTSSWAPKQFGRTPSFSQQDQKHQLAMNSVGDISPRPGFSERST